MQYFKIDELTHSATAQAQGIANVPTAEAVRNLELLVKAVLDPLRKAWGSPIIVTSGYRCEELNRAVDGAAYSYHRLGMAADIRPQRGALGDLYDLIHTMFCENRIGLTECYIDRTRRYIHIAYDASGFNTWPFIEDNGELRMEN